MTFTARTGEDRHVWSQCDQCAIGAWQINQKLADRWKRLHVCRRKETP